MLAGQLMFINSVLESKMFNVIKNALRRVHVNALRIRTAKLRPFVSVLKVLIIAPHPDDEVIGCGGLIARLVNEKHSPHIIIMSGGEGSHNGCCNTPKQDIVVARRRLTRNALAVLGVPVENIHELDYPDGSINTHNPETEKLKDLIAKIKPDAIFVPHWGEGWADHVNARKIGIELVLDDTEVYEYCVWMWYYNVWRGLDWRNAAILRMTSKEYERKLRAMDAYIKPLAPCGKPWSGVLPSLFIKANQWDKELYFKVVK